MAARRPRRAVVVSGTGSEDRLALPVELYTRGEDGTLTPVDLGGGDVVVAWADVTEKPVEFPPEAHTHTAAQVSDATAVGRSVVTAADAAAARSAIGAGTSSLALGATGTTAAAGNHTHPDLATQAALDALEARVAALEVDA